MKSLSDQQLLRDYAEGQSEAAFGELVRRHVDGVYSAARRMVCDAHLAEDVTQAVFLALARNGRRCAGRAVLSGWLHRTALNLASKAVRSAVRRRAWEQEAAMMNEGQGTGGDASWQRIASQLDEALEELSEPDRDAVMLRYFERKSAHEMAQVLGVSDEAAQKRVTRAVDRLREFLAKRGIAVGASGLVAVLGAHAVEAAPAGLTASLLPLGAATGVGVASVMNWFRSRAAAVLGAAMVAGSGVFLLQQERLARSEQRAQAMREEQSQLMTERDEALRAAEARAQEADRLRRDLAELVRRQSELNRRPQSAAAAGPGAGASPARRPLVAGVLMLEIGPTIPGLAQPVVAVAPFRTNLSVRIGQPFNALDVNDDVWALYATGLFSNVRANEEKTNDDVIVTYWLHDKLPQVQLGQFVPREKLNFAGYDTPEAAEQSLIWAMVTGNYVAVTNSFGPAAQAELAAPGAQAQFEEVLVKEAGKLKGIQFLARKAVSEDRVELKILVEDTQRNIAIQQLVRVEGLWKRGQSLGYRPGWDQDAQVYP